MSESVEKVEEQPVVEEKVVVSKPDTIKILKKGGKIVQITDEDKEKLQLLSHAQKRAENLRKGREKLQELRKLKQTAISDDMSIPKSETHAQIIQQNIDPDIIVSKIQEKLFADFDERIQRNSKVAYESIKEERKKKKQELIEAKSVPVIPVEIKKSPAELLIMQLTGRRK